MVVFVKARLPPLPRLLFCPAENYYACGYFVKILVKILIYLRVNCGFSSNFALYPLR